MILPGETEAGTAGTQPCRGISRWAHRDDERGREDSFLRRPTSIGFGRAPILLGNAYRSTPKSLPGDGHRAPRQNTNDPRAA